MPMMCPVCNGLYHLNLTCSCGAPLVDRGRLEDYAGPYSPYQGFREDLFPCQGGFEDEITGCVHLLSCRRCKRDERVTVAGEPG